MGGVRERNHHFDNMKALLIFLVVLGHALKNFSSMDGAADALYKIIFSFHMPAFLFVSGYFARCDAKRVLAKMFPVYIIFQCARFLLDFILGSIEAGAIVPVNGFQLFTPRWTLWYLFAIIVYQLLLPVFDTKNKKHRVAYLCLAVGLGLAIGMNKDAGNFMAMSRILTFLPFFLLGYYEKDAHLMITYGKRNHPVILRAVTGCLAVMMIIVFAIFHKQIGAKCFFGTLCYEAGGFTWYIRLLTWVIAFAWIWILLVWIPEREIPVVGTIGTNTLSVYLLHSLVIQILIVTPVKGWINGSLAGTIVLSVILTLVLSWSGFEHPIRKIEIPYRKKEKAA